MKKMPFYLFCFIVVTGMLANVVDLISPVSPIVYEIRSEASYKRQIDYWKTIITKYPTYKDGYMELARLSVLDRNNTMAAYYLNKWEQL